MVFLKDPKRSEYFSNSVPSYMRDWLVRKFSDKTEKLIMIPSEDLLTAISLKEDYEQFKYRMTNGENVQFLARVRVTVDIKPENPV
jgi:hypothetical protein